MCVARAAAVATASASSRISLAVSSSSSSSSSVEWGERHIPWHHRRVDVEAILAAVNAQLDTVDDARRAMIAASPLASQLATGVAAIRTRWPTAPDEPAAFGAYLGERIARQADLASALPRLRVDDLFLAWWAGRGDQAGIRAFEAAFADDLAKLVARFHRLPEAELRQRLRIKLFVGTPPRVGEYSGFGFLQNWLRVTAARAFVDVARSDQRTRLEDELDENELLGLSGGGDPRFAHLRDQLGGAVRRAFAAAVTSLEPRQRTFLRHAYVDRLTLDQIAATYAVHRATVARTLASAREALISQTRAAVAAELGVPTDELTSAIAALDSRLELSLSRVLRADPEGGHA